MKNRKHLSAKDVATLLGIPLVKVQRWVHQGKIPCKFKGSEYFFKRSEIVQWAEEHEFNIQQPDSDTIQKKSHDDKISLSSAIQRGGISHHLEGDDIFTVLKNAIDQIQLAEGTDKNLILDEIIFRESIASTGIGKGVAIPHLKDVRYLNLENPLIPVFFLEQPIDFNSIDGKPVSVLFFIFCPTPEYHLKMLSRLSFCLHKPQFLELLEKKAPEVQILAKIEEIEHQIDNE